MSTNYLKCAMLCSVAFTVLSVSPQAIGQNINKKASKDPILFIADETSNNKQTGITTAKGHVEIVQDNRIVTADSVRYNQKTDRITAIGNVIFYDSKGSTFYADKLSLNDKMKNGSIEKIKVLMANKARIVANGARRSDGNIMRMAKAVYTPCDVCAKNPDASPLWQIKANEIEHNEKDHQVIYHNAWLEFWGVPIIYTPYFSHPDPSVKRQSGFLAPRFGTSDDSGPFVQSRYYWVINKQQDLTFEPIITSKHGLILVGDYRYRFTNGYARLSGSLTRTSQDILVNWRPFTKKHVTRGHFFANGEYDINNHWRLTFDGGWTSDDTYLRKFSFFKDPGNYLQSNIRLEGFWGRNYFATNAYSFQNLYSNYRPDAPYVLPKITYQGYTKPDKLGGHWRYGSTFRSLYQESLSDSQMLTSNLSYSVPFTSSLGFITTVGASLRGDLYYTNYDEKGKYNPKEDGFKGRFIPRVSANWRYPFIRNGQTGQQLIEPIIAFYAAPTNVHNDEILNFDSKKVELDDLSLFLPSRTSGYDRIEGGTRVAYGLHLAQYWNSGKSINFFIGQTYRFTKDAQLANEFGIDKGASDYFGRLEVSPHPYLDAWYQFRFNKDSKKASRNELGFTFGPPNIRLSGSYIYLNKKADPNYSDVEQLDLALNLKFDDHWSAYISTQEDVRNGFNDPIKRSINLTYEDECFRLSFGFTREYLKEVDVEYNNSFNVQFVLKTLGGGGYSARQEDL